MKTTPYQRIIKNSMRAMGVFLSPKEVYAIGRNRAIIALAREEQESARLEKREEEELGDGKKKRTEQ